MSRPIRILLADDDTVTLRMLESIMSSWEFVPVLARDGQEAWDVLTQVDPPPVAILDWQMPVMDGPEICRRLAGRRDSAFVYCIILTAHRGMEALTRALESGAHDFVGKPFEAAELRSRINVGIRTWESEQRLSRYAKEMETLAAERAVQVLHAERLATLGTMAAGIGHEIKNPLSLLATNVQLLGRFWPKLEGFMRQSIPAAEAETRQVVEFAVAEMPEMLATMRRGVDRIHKIVEGLRSYSRLDSGGAAVHDLEEILTVAREFSSGTLAQAHVTMRQVVEPGPWLFAGNNIKLEQVLVNLLVNAADAVRGRVDPDIVVTVTGTAKEIQITVDDNGPGIPEALRQRIWDPFFTTKAMGHGTGLGLAVVHAIVKEHGGRVWIEDRPGGGARFVLVLPRVTG